MKKHISIILLLAAMNISAQTYSGGSGTYSNPYLISSKADMEALANAVKSGTNYAGKCFRLTQNLTGSNALTTSVGDYVQRYAFQGLFDGGGYEIELNKAPTGIFGFIQNATIQNLGVSGTVSGSNTLNNYLYVGGICGYSNNSTIAYCSNAATISAISTNSESYAEVHVGGICGYAYGTTITDCFNRGTVSGSSYFACISGGICGWMYVNNYILNCYNAGNISSTVSQTNNAVYAGGIYGYTNYYGSGQSIIKNCFSANAGIETKYTDGGQADFGAGRIAGISSDYSESGNNYALSTMTINGSTIAGSDKTGKDGAGTSLSNFKSQSWIQNNLGWDFTAIWQMSASGSANQGFPVFGNAAKPIIQYTISAKAGNNGSISPSGDKKINQGESISYTFTPNAGFQIYQVLIDGSNNYEAISSSTYTFAEITTNHTIEVVFRLVSPPTFSGGQGTKASPYLISSPADMAALADAVEGGTTYEGKFFRLTQNLTGANAVSTSVGVYTGSYRVNFFGGVFDGGGFEIEIKNVEGGVFGNLYYATIQNLGVSGTVTTPASQTNYGFAGGISAYATYSKIYACHNSATVSTKGITSSNDNYLGGICGSADNSEIMYCYNTGSISSSVALPVSCLEGGITGGSNNTQISNCFNFGQVSGSGSNFGFYSSGISGIVNMGTITNCYNAGNVSAVCKTYNYSVAGGICGSPRNSLIKNCISTNSSIEVKYNDGSEIGYAAGRIAGEYNNNPVFSNNYALSTMTVNGSSVINSDATSQDGAENSLSNFKLQWWIQSNLGWDFNKVWQMSATGSLFQGFPVFRSEPITIYYVITATSTNNGSISSSGPSSVGLGESKTYTITPNAGFQLYQVMIDGSYNNEAVSSGTYTFTEVSKNHTIEVFFRPVSLPIFSGGAGTADNPYLISSNADMVALAGAVEGGTSYENTYFRLTKSLTGSNAVGTSVGNNYNSFHGIFDGRAYEIELNNAPTGVFGFIQNATIQNLGVSGTVSGSSALNYNLYAGGICGYSYNSTIAYCSNAATISAISTYTESYSEVIAGGICGYANGTTITDCFNRGAVSCSSSFSCYSGGICGEVTYGNILNCYNVGNISAECQTGNYSPNAGGICGYTWSWGADQYSIKNCFSANASIEAKYGSGSQNSTNAGRIAGSIGGNFDFSKNYASSAMTINGSTVSSSDVTSRYGTGTSLSNFKSQSWIQSNLGWDFTAIWQMSSSGSINLGFPIFTAVANPVYYTITASSGSGGSITPSGALLVSQGNDQSFTITPDTGYEIKDVLIDGYADTNAKSNKFYKFSNVTGNHTISVSFGKIYTITASANAGGSISPSGSISVIEGTDRQFTFTPNTGYEIDDVLVDGKSDSSAKTNGNYTFLGISSDHSISVSFKLKQYTITVSAGSNGIILPSGNASITYGSSQTFTFAPNTCYEIDQVLVDGSNKPDAVSAGSYIFSNVTANHTLSVSFKPKQYTITASASNFGSISPNGAKTVNCGSDQTYTFTPNTGYLIDNVLVDGASNTSAIADGSYTFSNVTSDHTISVGFKPECLSNIVVQVWDDVLSVINNPTRNGGYTFVGYQWLKNGAEIPGETSGNLYLANEEDKTMSQYTCRVTTSTGQTLQSCPMQLLRSGTNISVYPNPTGGTVTIESSTLEEGDRIEVYSSTGTLVKQYSAGSRQTKIDLANQPKGIYIIKVNGKQVKVILL